MRKIIRKKDLPAIRVFAGTSRNHETPDKAIYVLTMEDGKGHFLKMDPEAVSSGSDHITQHFILLRALSKTISVLSESIIEPFRLIFYCDDSNIAFEWNVEHKEDGMFSFQTEDRELWEKIADTVRGRNIDLVISGPDSILSAVSKIEKRRANSY